jgi:hypothetical protein
MIPLFIGGTGRSGTTIALELVGKHSKVYASNPPEIKTLTNKNGYLDQYLNKKITKEDVKNAYVAEFNKQNIDKPSILYWADSTPENIKYSQPLSIIFSNSLFIHMIRDGRDSGYSEYKIMNGQGHAKTPFDGLEFWRKRIIQSVEGLNTVNSSRHISIRLENLVLHNREKEKENIFNFLNLNTEKKVTQFFSSDVVDTKMTIGEWKSMEDWKSFDNRYSEILKDLLKINIFIEKMY